MPELQQTFYGVRQASYGMPTAVQDQILFYNRPMDLKHYISFTGLLNWPTVMVTLVTFGQFNVTR